ncbi:MAG TPA: hypothetical protein VKV20_02045 [Ktedonobacteraceae bacterium]|jgi:chromosome segregation ATPase|nr:hypothetical protein [Ktedonobacteraceae bacterium]
MPADRESRMAQILRFEQQLERLQQKYNRLEIRRTQMQQQLDRLEQRYSTLEASINKHRQQLERIMKQQAPLLREQQQLEQLIALLKEQNENELW